MHPTVKSERQGNVAIVTLNRPESLNAVNRELRELLISTLDQANADASVRAVVIAPNGNPKDVAARRIAYLEKYAPEFKRQLEQVRHGQANPLPRGARDAYRFVKRVDDTEWRGLNSPEGETIVTEWNVAGPDGKFPAVCTP